MDFTEFVWNVGVSIIQFLIGLILAIFSVYFGIRVLNVLTKNLDEWKELKKGNVAVGILVAAVVLSVAVVVESGVSSVLSALPAQSTATQLALGLLVSFINLLIGVVAAMIGIYFAITVFDQLTGHIDEFAELKKGNVAIAVLLAAVLLAVSFILKGAVSELITTLNIAGLFGL